MYELLWKILPGLPQGYDPILCLIHTEAREHMSVLITRESNNKSKYPRSIFIKCYGAIF
jgi:hypothetical protein